MKIESIINYEMDQNTYIVSENGDAVAIDPGCRGEQAAEFCRGRGLSLQYILLTHCHYDHIAGVNELKELTGAKIVCGRECARALLDPVVNLSEAFCNHPLLVYADVVLADGETVTAGNMSFRLLETPGHTADSVCYVTEDAVFTGDTVFRMNVGRWDLPTGSQEALERSIRERVYALDPRLEVYPGHGAKSSVGYEMRYNLYVKAK